VEQLYTAVNSCHLTRWNFKTMFDCSATPMSSCALPADIRNSVALPDERLFSEFLRKGVELFDKVIGGIDIDGGDLDPNVCKVSLGEFRVDRVP
jgi:hypothetical protein